MPYHYSQIKSCETVCVQTPVGTVPRLPWQVWVTLVDGRGEWRQVKWTETAFDAELRMADATVTPVGSRYTIDGYVIGDDTTPQGFPIKAEVTVTEGSYNTPDAQPKATPLPLADVHLTGNNRLTTNCNRLIDHILELDITQQLYNYRVTYGLPTDGYTVADGWDSPHTKLKGHGTGHYLSALAFAYSSSTDALKREQLLMRMRRMVTEMRECQERTFVYDVRLGRYREARDYAPDSVLQQMRGTWEAFDDYSADYRNYGYGYLNAITAAHCVLIEKYAPYNNESGVWAPYYTVHKQLAGLIDVATATAGTDVADKALLIARDMGLWVWNRMHYRTHIDRSDTKEARRQRFGNRYEMWNLYIAGEVGGMCESLSRLSEMMTDSITKQRLIEAANCFDTPALFDHVARNVDDIRNRHANQHIPMFVGALRSFASNENPYYYNLALNFWNMIQGRYAYATGGVGNGEMWRQPYTQMTSMNTNTMSDDMGHRLPNPDLNETCCAYNLAKLTKDLNCYDPDDARYMDYYERVLYNQIVGSVHPDEHSVCYQYAVGLNATKPFGNETPQSSCCGGTGSENHVKYQEATYFHNDSTLWIALYMPTEAHWREKDLIIRQESEWPATKARITISGSTPNPSHKERGENSSLSVKLRVPYWATSGFDIRLNGKSLATHYQPCSYFEIPQREWTANDTIEVVMPYTEHIWWGPDKMDMAYTADGDGKLKSFAPKWLGAVMHGPLVMTATDVRSWEDAEVSVDRLSERARSFVPDYAVTEHATHYLRIGLPTTKGKNTAAYDRQQIDQLIAEAEARIAQQKNNAWAPHGFKRMTEALAKVRKGGDAEVSALNVALLTMRPSTLAEPEDLAPLLKALQQHTQDGSNANKRSANSDAIRYARMVIRYVNDGSGTKDMIEKALKQL